MSSATDQLIELAQQLRKFHDAEYEAQRQAIRQVWSLPIETRVRKGSAIANVRLVLPAVDNKSKEAATRILSRAGVQPTAQKIRNFLGSILSLNNSALVRVSANHSNFREGSYVMLHKGNPYDEQNAYALEVKSVSERTLTLDASYGRNPQELAPSTGWVLDGNVPDLRWILQKAIDQLPKASATGALADVFVHKKPPAFDANRRAEAKLIAKSVNFNPRQREAFVNAFATENYYLIQGPPGTGKTWVLAHLAVAFARSGQRVLITSSNHRGINNALRKIQETTGYPHLLKVGKKTDAVDLGSVPNNEQCPSLEPVAGEAFIVGATCLALYTQRLEGRKFDVVIADEASQLTQLQAAAAMLAGTKYVFIGDHQQMPPIIAAEHADSTRSQSVFEYLFDFAPSTRLNTTYRLNEELARFPGQQFYDGDFTSHESVAFRSLDLAISPTAFLDILDPTKPSTFVDLAHRNTKTSEQSEAHYIAEMVAELLACGTPPGEIAIVAPFRAQCREIGRALMKRCAHIAPEELGQIVVDTVERMQGQERDVTFLSLTVGKFDSALQRASFFFLPNRLNVAITRARVKRIVVGSSHLTDGDFGAPELQAWAYIFRDFLASCHRITRLKLLKRARLGTTHPDVKLLDAVLHQVSNQL